MADDGVELLYGRLEEADRDQLPPYHFKNRARGVAHPRLALTKGLVKGLDDVRCHRKKIAR